MSVRFSSRWVWALILGCAGGLALRARSAAGGDFGETDVPSGTVAFFASDDTTCPPGWRVASELRGRLAIGVTTVDTVGKQVGLPLASEEDRTHVHAFSSSVELPYKSISALNGSNHQGAAASKYLDSGISDPAASGLPFVQLMACVKP